MNSLNHNNAVVYVKSNINRNKLALKQYTLRHVFGHMSNGIKIYIFFLVPLCLIYNIYVDIYKVIVLLFIVRAQNRALPGGENTEIKKTPFPYQCLWKTRDLEWRPFLMRK